MKKETTDSSLRNESLKWDALKWWSRKSIRQQDELAKKYFQTEYASYLEDSKVYEIYQQETNPKAIIEYRAVIKNLDRNQYVKTEKNGALTYTKDENAALCFYEESDAEATLEMLNDTKKDCFQLITLEPKAIIGSGVEEKEWMVEYLPHNRYCYIIDERDRLIATTSDIGSEKRISEDEMKANAKLICEAVNNYQSLRDSNAELQKATDNLPKWLREAAESLEFQANQRGATNTLVPKLKWYADKLEKAKSIN